MFSSPGNIAFSFFDIDIHWYGLIMSLSILLGIFVAIIIKNRFYKEITTDSLLDISFVLIVTGIISARLYYVIVDWTYFSKHLREIFCIWNGGLSIHGAIIGCIIAFLFYAKKHKLNFLKYADLLCFGLISGQILGRWGNFFNSEAFGLPTDIFCKLYIPYSARPIEYKTFEYFHPTFLYESICNMIVLCTMYFLLKKIKKENYGIIFFSYLILYSTVRLLIEQLRIDSVLNINNIPIAQIISIILILIGLISLIILNVKYKKRSL